MPRAALTVAEVFRRYGDTFRAEVGAALSTAHSRVMTAIEQCRTAALGGHVEQCDHCGHRRVWKLLGDTAAVTALLDRVLHHAHILKCGPRSWRTRSRPPCQHRTP